MDRIPLKIFQGVLCSYSFTECIIGDSMTYLVPQLEHIYYLLFKGQDKDFKGL